MGNGKQKLGKYGEWLAAEYLIDTGMRLLDRNWRCHLGEIDIIALDGEVMVVCEVKTRRSTRYGTPAEAVGRAKQQRLRALALEWSKAKRLRAPVIRFDVVSVLPQRRGGPPRIEHIRNAF